MKRTWIFIIICLTIGLAHTWAFGQTPLFITQVTGVAGEYVYPEVIIENDEAICQFDMQIDFPEAVIDTIWVERIGRLLDYNGWFVAQVNASNGNYRVLFTGFPPNSLPAGSGAILRLHIRVSEDAPYGSHLLDITDQLVVGRCPAGNLETVVTDGVILINPPSESPDIYLSEEEYDFGEILTGENREWSFSIANHGLENLNVSAIVSDNPIFTVRTPPMPMIINSLQDTLIHVQFSPTTAGEHQATISISSNDLDEANVTVSVAGSAVDPEPEIDLSLAAYNFGSVLSGNTATRYLTIYNRGTGNLNIQSITSDTPAIFGVEGVSPPVTIPPVNSINVTLTFTPPAVAEYSGNITIISNDPQYDTIVLPMQGQGVGEAAQMMLVANQHDFGGVNIGDTEEWSLRILSVGNIPLQITGLQINDTRFTHAEIALPYTVEAGSPLDLDVYFSPDQADAYEATLQITSNDASSSVQTVSLTGNGLTQDIHIDDGSHDFGTIQIDQYADWNFTIENLGSAPLRIEEINSTHSDFVVISPTFPQDVDANSELDVVVRFLPLSEGAAQGELQVISDDPDEPTVVIVLSGAGFATLPLINISETFYNFGELETDEIDDWQLQIWNTGMADLIVSEISSDISSVFYAIGLSLPLVISPNQDPVTITVRFAPQNPENYESILSIDHNGDNSPSQINLSGRGVLPPSGLALYVESVTTAAGTTAPVLITMSNQEEVTAIQLEIEVPDLDLTVGQILQIDVGHDFPIFNYNYQGNGVYLVTLAGGSAEPDSGSLLRLSVTAHTDAFAGEHTISIRSVTASNPGNPDIDYQTVDGLFTIAGQADIQTSLTEHDFGQINIGESADHGFFIYNNGSVALLISDADFRQGDDGFSLIEPLFPQTVAVGGTLQVQVRFAPTEAGPHTGQLEITGDDPGNSLLAIDFIGVGYTPLPEIHLSATELDFGDVEVDEFSDQQITIYNYGQGDLVITDGSLSQGIHFQVQGSPFPDVIAAGEEAAATIRFAPQTSGSIQDALQIFHNDADENPAQITLQGTGLQEDIELSGGCDTGDTPVGNDSFCEFHIQNSGNANLSVTGIDSDNDRFTIAFPTSFPQTILPLGELTVRVDFAPVEPGEALAVVTVASSDPDESTVQTTITGQGVAPIITVTPQTMDFGYAEIGEPKQRQLVVGNSGTDQLTIYGAVPQTGQFMLNIAQSFPMTMDPAEQQTIDLTLTAFGLGELSGSLTLISNGYNESQTVVEVTAIGYECLVQLSEESYDFGDVRVGETQEWDVTVTNACPVSPLTIESISFGSDDYSSNLTSFPFTILPDSARTIVVDFTPSEMGDRSTTMTIITDVVEIVIDLDGTGVAPIIIPEAVLHDFGDVEPEQTVVWDFEIANSGTATGEIELTDPFVGNAFQLVDPPDFPMSLGVDESHTLTISFTPTESVEYQDSLRFQTDDAQHPTIIVTVVGQGIVLYPDIFIDADDLSHDFGDVGVDSTREWSFDIQNIGQNVLLLDSLAVSLEEFDYELPPGADSIEPEGRIQVTMRFQSNSETPISLSDTLRIWSNDPDEPLIHVYLFADVVGIEDGEIAFSDQIELFQNFPNPFTRQTTIGLNLPHSQSISVEIFNAIGQNIRTLDPGRLNAGYHELVWNGQNDNRKNAPSGIYFYRLTTPTLKRVGKMTRISP